jgi:hypothetical protein
MTFSMRAALLVVALLVVHAAAPVVFGDEGMWLFTNPPAKHLKDKYGFEVTDKWLNHVRKASVRFNSGGSGSFVSPDGLVMTNHHVGLDALQKMSDQKKKDFVKDGFHAKSGAEEFKCEGMELNVLQKITDVTTEVNAGVKPEMSPAEAFAARRANIARIEKDAADQTKLKPQVVTLYQGGVYNLYLFKKYTDVRIVFAPEQQIAFYGGDPDNFEYPRYDLDICLFRVYEDDKPVKVEHYLKWSKGGAKDGELVFVSGHPGRTNRMNTVAELEYLRDTGYPFLMQRLNRMEVTLKAFSDRTEENKRIAKEFLFSVQNSRKARIGGLAGLLDPEIMSQKKEYEKKLKQKFDEMPQSKERVSPWDTIAAAQKVRVKAIHPYTILEGGGGFNTDYFGIARTLLRAGDEIPKKNTERLAEYTDANLDSLKHRLFSDEKIYPEYEIVKLTDSLTFLCSQLGYNDPLTQKVLNGKSPSERATELVTGTKLAGVDMRKKLFAGGAKAVADAKDPMIELARTIDEESRRLRKIMDEQVGEVSRQAYAEIAKVKFALEGTSTYPDATFTLRLSFGVVKGFEENGKPVPFETTFAGLYERSKEHNNQEPFDLPQRWVDRKSKLDLNTPFNFVCTADIIGGNSGSPVVNAAGEVVGLIFDGNIQSLVLDFAYSEKQARAVSVHSQGIIEALRKVYDANEIADEMTGVMKR